MVRLSSSSQRLGRISGRHSATIVHNCALVVGPVAHCGTAWPLALLGSKAISYLAGGPVDHTVPNVAS